MYALSHLQSASSSRALPYDLAACYWLLSSAHTCTNAHAKCIGGLSSQVSPDCSRMTLQQYADFLKVIYLALNFLPLLDWLAFAAQISLGIASNLSQTCFAGREFETAVC